MFGIRTGIYLLIQILSFYLNFTSGLDCYACGLSMISPDKDELPYSIGQVTH